MILYACLSGEERTDRFSNAIELQRPNEKENVLEHGRGKMRRGNKQVDILEGRQKHHRHE